MGSLNTNTALLLIVINITFFALASSTKVIGPPKTPTIPSNPTPTIPANSTFPTKPAKCPRHTLKFGVCGNWLGLVYEIISTPPSKECCTLITGLADVEAATCLCTAIKANVLGIVNVKAPVADVISLSTSAFKNLNGTSSVSVTESNRQEVSMGKHDAFQLSMIEKDSPIVKLDGQEATKTKDEAVEGSTDHQRDRKPTLDRINLDSWEEVSKKPAAHESNPFTGFVKACVTALSKLFSN